MSELSTPPQKSWTVAEAKARLSEILRLASENGPQYIGAKKTHVLVSVEQWNALAQTKKPLGRWLVEEMADLGEELSLPDRKEPEREIPFQS